MAAIMYAFSNSNFIDPCCFFKRFSMAVVHVRVYSMYILGCAEIFPIPTSIGSLKQFVLLFAVLGTLMELGISPIVTSGLIMQVTEMSS